MAPLAPGTSGIAFPVHADRGQCGLVVFLGSEIVLAAGRALRNPRPLLFPVRRCRPHPSGRRRRTRAISKRELECLKLTANGNTSEEIARLLKLSVHTANQYLTQSTQKLNAVNRNQAVAKALRLGLDRIVGSNGGVKTLQRASSTLRMRACSITASSSAVLCSGSSPGFSNDT